MMAFRKAPTASALLGALVSVAACGNTTGDRALSGAGLGTAGGAAIGALTGTSLLGGALIGGAAGGAAVALTNPNQVNLGKPAWR